MSDLNQIILSGKVGQEPELIQVENYSLLAKLSIATNKRWTKNGVQNDKVEWHTVIFGGKLAEVVKAFVHKGDKLFVRGELCYRAWEDKGGNKHKTSEIRGKQLTFLSPKKEASAHSALLTDEGDNRQSDVVCE